MSDLFGWVFSFPNIWFAIGAGTLFTVGEIASRWSGAVSQHPAVPKSFFLTIDLLLLLFCGASAVILLTQLNPEAGSALQQLQAMSESESGGIGATLMLVAVEVGGVIGLMGGILWPLAIWLGGTEYQLHRLAAQAWRELDDAEEAAHWLDEHGVGLTPTFFALLASLPLLWVWGDIVFFGLSAGTGIVGLMRMQLQSESTQWIVERVLELRKQRLKR